MQACGDAHTSSLKQEAPTFKVVGSSLYIFPLIFLLYALEHKTFGLNVLFFSAIIAFVIYRTHSQVPHLRGLFNIKKKEGIQWQILNQQLRELK